MDYADDVALLAELFEALVSTLEIFSVESQGLGLEYALPSEESRSRLFSASTTCSLITSDCKSDQDVKRRLGIASAAFASLSRVWRSKHLSRTNKLRTYNTLVLSVLLYGAESWTITKSLAEKLDAFDSQCLRKIEGICWHDFISNETVRLRTNQPPVTRRIVKQQMTFLGHASRAVPTQDVIKLLTPQPDPTWRRTRGRPRARWEDQLFPTLGELGVRDDWRVWAENRSSWRDLCGTVAAMRQTMMPAED
ncbi:hypothetical protein Bbelb_427640 [Branchiostoma belcheri]|nr:hypothetical protein Bbelb_427640 [Branchiostoma belcheri]